MIKPPALLPGDTVLVVAPASPPDPYEVYRGATKLRELGFHVRFSSLVRKMRSRGYLAGTDEERARTVNRAFEDESVQGIMCAEGGYGTLRILDRIDYDLIRSNPKVLIGYSDITGLQTAIQQRAGVVTFHGPMATLESDAHFSSYTRDQLVSVITEPDHRGAVPTPPDGPLVRIVREGVGRGPLVGGNLALVAATLGTPFEIDTRGKVLFLEEWNEPTYTIDTMLTQLRLAGKLDEAAGIVFGEFVNCTSDGILPGHSVEEVIQEVCGDLSVPVLYGLACGHGRDIATLPLGVEATVDADAGELVLEEGAVRPREVLPSGDKVRRDKEEKKA